MYQATTILIENLASKEVIKKVAKAILRAQDIKETSWDASREEYGIDDHSSAIKAVNEQNLDGFWVSVILRLNLSHWNDIQSWAQEILKEGE